MMTKQEAMQRAVNRAMASKIKTHADFQDFFKWAGGARIQ